MMVIFILNDLAVDVALLVLACKIDLIISKSAN